MPAAVHSVSYQSNAVSAFSDAVQSANCGDAVPGGDAMSVDGHAVPDGVNTVPKSAHAMLRHRNAVSAGTDFVSAGTDALPDDTDGVLPTAGRHNLRHRRPGCGDAGDKTLPGGQY